MAKLYNPTATPVQANASLAARVPDLRGKTIGLLDISKAKGNFFLDRLAERLEAQFQPAEIIRRMKPTFARPAPADTRQELAQKCHLIIEALAD
jgi:hypothetical protein